MRGAEEPPRQIEASNNQLGEGGIGQASGVGAPFPNDRLLHSESAEPPAQQNLGRLGEPCIGMQVPMDDFLDSGIDDQGDLTPNMFQVGDDLMALFSVFEQSQQFPLETAGLDFQTGSDVQDAEVNEDGEIWRRFQGLI